MGKIDYIALGLQSAEKTAAVAATMFPPVQSEGLEPNVEEMEYDETVGSRAPTEQEYGGRFYEGDIEGAARPLSFGGFLTMCFGTPTSANPVFARENTTAYEVGDLLTEATHLFEVVVAGTTAASAPAGLGTSTLGDQVTDGTATLENVGPAATTVWEHTWNPTAANKLPVPATVWTVNADFTPGVVDKFVGTYLNELAVEVEANGYLTFSASLAAMILDQTLTTGTAPVLTRDTTAKWAFHQITAQLAVLGSNLSTLETENFTLNYNNNLETGLFGLGSQELRTIRPGNIECGVNFRPLEAYAAHYRRWLLTSPEFVKLRLRASGQPFSDTVGVRNTLQLDFNKLQYMSAPINIDAGEVMTGVDVETRSVIDDGGTLMTVKLRNSNPGTIYAP